VNAHIRTGSATETAINRRSELLREAETLVNGDRNNAYGPPDQDFERTAIMWTTYMNGRRIFEAHDVAIMMALLKISRLSWEPTKKDSWVDLAGYAACGYEIITNKEEQK
jgi:hypothetical protein